MGEGERQWIKQGDDGESKSFPGRVLNSGGCRILSPSLSPYPVSRWVCASGFTNIGFRNVYVMNRPLCIMKACSWGRERGSRSAGLLAVEACYEWERGEQEELG